MVAATNPRTTLHPAMIRQPPAAYNAKGQDFEMREPVCPFLPSSSSPTLTLPSLPFSPSQTQTHTNPPPKVQTRHHVHVTHPHRHPLPHQQQRIARIGQRTRRRKRTRTPERWRRKRRIVLWNLCRIGLFWMFGVLLLVWESGTRRDRERERESTLRLFFLGFGGLDGAGSCFTCDGLRRVACLWLYEMNFWFFNWYFFVWNDEIL